MRFVNLRGMTFTAGLIVMAGLGLAREQAPAAPAPAPVAAPTPWPGLTGAIGEIRTFAFSDDKTAINTSQLQIRSLRERGWISCRGQELAITEFPELGAVLKVIRPDRSIGSVWGAAARDISFNVPDLRGLFLRGYQMSEEAFKPGNNAGEPEPSTRGALRGDMPATGDPGNPSGVGSYQADQLQTHEHLQTRSPEYSNSNQPPYNGMYHASGGSNRGDANVATRGPQPAYGAPAVRAGGETRAKNVQVMYCIYTGRKVRVDLP